MSQEYVDFMMKYVDTELELSNFDKSDFGKALREYLKQLFALGQGNDWQTKSLNGMVLKLIERKPIAPLLEDEFEEVNCIVNIVDGQPVFGTRMQHKRCPFVYKDGDKYFDDHGIAFQRKDGSIWYGSNNGYNSTVEITSFPYFREEKIVYTGE